MPLGTVRLSPRSFLVLAFMRRQVTPQLMPRPSKQSLPKADRYLQLTTSLKYLQLKHTLNSQLTITFVNVCELLYIKFILFDDSTIKVIKYCINIVYRNLLCCVDHWNIYWSKKFSLFYVMLWCGKCIGKEPLLLACQWKS